MEFMITVRYSQMNRKNKWSLFSFILAMIILILSKGFVLK